MDAARQGELEIRTEAGTGRALPQGDREAQDLVERVPFLMLGLDLPPAPLYKDKDKKDIIPQVRSAIKQVKGIRALWLLAQPLARQFWDSLSKTNLRLALNPSCQEECDSCSSQ